MFMFVIMFRLRDFRGAYPAVLCLVSFIRSNLLLSKVQKAARKGVSIKHGKGMQTLLHGFR